MTRTLEHPAYGPLFIRIADEPDAVALIHADYPAATRGEVETLVHDTRVHLVNAARLYEDGPAALQAIFGQSGNWDAAATAEVAESQEADRLMRAFLARHVPDFP